VALKWLAVMAKRQQSAEGEQVRNLFFSKRRIAVLGAIMALALAGGGAAYAYFTSSGTGSGTGTVGSSTALTVLPSPITFTGGPLYPGTGLATDTADGIETFTYTVHNPGPGSQLFSAATIAVTAAPAECTLTWFSVDGTGSDTDTVTLATPIDLAAGQTSGPQTFTLQLIDVDSSQNSCESSSPTVTVNVS
jgi:hypothetical protein